MGLKMPDLQLQIRLRFFMVNSSNKHLRQKIIENITGINQTKSESKCERILSKKMIRIIINLVQILHLKKCTTPPPFASLFP